MTAFGSKLIHRLAIVTPTDTGALDDYGQPVAGSPDIEYVAGLVQPKTAREVALVSQGGAPFSDHTIFMADHVVSGSAYIRDDPDTGRRFDIVGIRSFEYGIAPHLEIDAKLVGSPLGPTVGS